MSMSMKLTKYVEASFWETFRIEICIFERSINRWIKIHILSNIWQSYYTLKNHVHIVNDIITGVTEFPCTFPEEWRGNEFSVYRGSPPILSSIWYFEDNGVEFEADGDPGFCYQITDQFYIIRYVLK